MPKDISLIQLGTTQTGQLQPGTNQTDENNIIELDGTTPVTAIQEAEFQSVVANDEDNRLDHFIEKDGIAFAGTHLIIDLWDAERLDDIVHIEETFNDCIEAAGATLLHMHFHHFTPNGGVSGVAVLAESHISIHTWPECGYAALDIFMCGDAEPHKAIPILKSAFRTNRVQLGDHKRGMIG